jgi:hypothetical protein
MNLKKYLRENKGQVTVICLLLFSFWVIYAILTRGHFHFKEEVQLASGEMILIDRKIVATPLGEIGGPGGWDPKYNSLRIVDPDFSDTPPLWESKEGLIPLLLDRDPQTKEWFLVVSFFMCEAWTYLGRPKHPYAEFRVRDGEWQRVALSPEVMGKVTNIYPNIPSDGGFWTVNIELKRYKFDGTAKMYRQIDPDRIKNVC